MPEQVDPYNVTKRAAGSGQVVGRLEVLEALPWVHEATWDKADGAFPVRLTRSWWSRAGRSEADPLLRQAVPSPGELEPWPWELDDPVGDEARSPVPWVVQKHPDRALLLLTKRCHLYCRYCFRRNHSPGDREDPSPEELERALRVVEGSGAREVILSGGDPLAVRDELLFGVIDRLRLRVPVVRIHTRAPITAPTRVTASLVAGLRARRPVWVVVHVNHARELGPEVDGALSRLVDAGLPVLNQAVLLAGVNDEVEALAELCEALVQRGVFPYYLHHPDPARGAGDFYVDPGRGLALVQALAGRVSGVALPRYVVDLPDGSGKVDVLQAFTRGVLVRRPSPLGGAE